MPNYRRYITGQAISLSGTWMQMAAQSWLVLTLSGSATTLGVIVALQTLPVLLLGPYGGVVADRVDKRRLMIVLQAAMGLQALVLGLLTITGAVHLWEVGLLGAAARAQQRLRVPGPAGLHARDGRARDLRNAVSLNSVLGQRGPGHRPRRSPDPDRDGGDGVCFLINAASFAP